MIRVIVADDNEAFNSACSRILTKDNNIKVVAQTTDGEETLKEYKRLKPDVLLLDLKMPKMDGLEIIEELEKNTEEKKKCNIIVISGDWEMRLKLQNIAKVYASIPKPINYDELIEKIKEIKPQKTPEKIVKNYIYELGVTDAYSPLYDYLVDAIILTVKRPELVDDLKTVYHIVSDKHHTDDNSVQWRIRNNVQKIEKYTSKEAMQNIFRINNSEMALAPRHFFMMTGEYFDSYRQ